MFNYILLILLVASTAFGQAKFQPDDLRVKPKSSGSRPSGVNGQYYSNSSTLATQFYWGGWQTAATDSNTLTLTNKTIDCNNNTCSNFPATTLNITNDNATNATMYPLWFTSTSGQLVPYVSSTKLTFNPSTGVLTATAFAGNLTGNVTGNLAGNVTGDVTGTATNATNGTTVAVSNSASYYPLMVASSSNGNQAFNLDASGLTYNPSTDTLSSTNVSATTFTGALTGTASGNVAKSEYTGKAVFLIGTGAGTYAAVGSGATNGQTLIADSAEASGWRVGNGGGGGGGGALEWIVSNANAPLSEVENDNRVYLFRNGETEYIYTNIRVPSTYTAGNQVNLRLVFYSPDNSNTVQFTCLATLIRTGTDAITSTTNQHTSTQGATTLDTANNVESQVCDLSENDGEINAVDLSAGDLIKVRVTRDSDSATSDVRLLPYAAEVTFQ